ncbi:MAG: tRNA glutamyl-Q synthetase, partial [Mucilaginibacter polytrichastri]|nr:tRNA glutamyl-Q synthetase [Mucilaginibacter polytrichastri]
MQARHSRIAPTPSGFLHEGNAFSFVLTWLLVRQSGGKLRLRIDDYDLPRVRREFIEDIFRLLDWLGLDWDEGPQSPDDHTRNFSSKRRYDLYRNLLSVFLSFELAYTCSCSKKELAKGACTCKEKKGAVAIAIRNT